jgi:hypothetical protein
MRPYGDALSISLIGLDMSSATTVPKRETNNVARPDLLKELLLRRNVDQKLRAALLDGHREAYDQLLGVDDENANWLEKIVNEVGWPGLSLVGHEGAHAAWMLAQHADRHPAFQRRCQALMQEAVARGEASPADLAHLTDRVLLTQGKQQIFGTQTTARDRRFVACRLRDPDRVDELRASVGLEPLETYLRRVLEQYGEPSPAQVRCRTCGVTNDVWLPEIGGEVTMRCASCGSLASIRAQFPDR